MTPVTPTSRRALRGAARRQRARTRMRSMLVTSAVVLGATILGVSAAGGTYAFLNAQQPVPSAVVSAGDMSLRINGVQTVDLGAWALSPATPQAKPFTVSNVGDVRSAISATAQITSNTAIGANVVARLTPVATEAQCAVGLTGSQAPLAGYTIQNLATLAKGASQAYCLELSLAPNTPGSQAGQSVTFTLTLKGAQVAN